MTVPSRPLSHAVVTERSDLGGLVMPNVIVS
jgi:hypothetical protein